MSLPSRLIVAPPVPSVPDGTPVRVEWVDGALLISPGEGPSTALIMLTKAVAAAHGETIVVCAASVVGRGDLFLRIMDSLAAHPLSPQGVRLVLLGQGPDRATLERGYLAAASSSGRVVIGPVGPVAVASDGSCAATSSSDDPGGWLACSADGVVLRQPPWTHWPNWPDLAAFDSSVAGGRVVVHAVPAGVWLLPRDVAPGRAGVVPSLARDGGGMNIFVGGADRCLARSDLAAALAAMALPRSARVVLLPGAVAGPDSVHGLPARAIAAVPVLDEMGWRLEPVGADGSILAAQTQREGPTRPAGRAGLVAGESQTAPAPQRPWVGGVPGHRTPAGWSLVDGVGLGAGPATVGVVIEVAGARTGFIVGERRVGGRDFADVVRAAVDPGDGDVVLVGGGYPAKALKALASALRSTVVVADGPITVTGTGQLVTTGTFHAWSAAQLPRALGPVLPAGPEDAWQVALARAAGKLVTGELPTGELVAAARHGDRVGQPRRVTGAITSAIRSRSRPAAPSASSPRGVVPAECDADERRALEAAVADSFASHAAQVRPALAGAEDEDAARTVAGLVALRAYWAAERSAVNHWLRGAGDADPGLATIAACACAGLARLPVVFGAVFATAAQGDPTAYEVGERLVEPGFVDAALAPVGSESSDVAGRGPYAGPGIDYVIWSTTARRLGDIVHGGPATVLFRPGTGFTVLDRQFGEPRPKVYLADATLGAQVSGPLARLRSAAVASLSAGRGADSAHVYIEAIGLDPTGRPIN